MSKLSNAKILVIDEDVFARHGLADDLRSYSAMVRMAHGVEDASALLQQHEFDAVVFDMTQLQDQFCSILKSKNPNHGNKPIFIVHSSPAKIGRRILASPEIFRIFAKPCNTNGIVDAIYMHLSKA